MFSQTQVSVGRLAPKDDGARPVRRLLRIAEIRTSPTNPRITFDPEKLQKLADSIAEHGLLQSPLVRPIAAPNTDPSRSIYDLALSADNALLLANQGLTCIGNLINMGKAIAPTPKTPVGVLVYEALKRIKTFPLVEAAKVRDALLPSPQTYELVDGERRFRAAQIAGLKEIECDVRELSDREVLEIQLVANEQREDVLPLERAAAYGRLVDAGGKIAEIAKAISQSESTVRQILLLRNIPANLAAAVNAGEVAPYTASLVGRVPGTAARERVAYFVLNRIGLNYVNIEQFKDAKWKPAAWQLSSTPMTTRDVEALIAAFCTVELSKRANFSLNIVDLAGAPSCEACPKRSGNARLEDPDGFAGIRADVCTDPACFEAKQKAHLEQLQARAAEIGRKVIAGKEAEKIFDRWEPGQLQYGCGYVDLAAHLPPSATPKRMTFAKALKGFPERELITAIDAEGKVHTLAEYESAEFHIRAIHGIKLPKIDTGAGARANVPKSAKEKADEAKRREEDRLHREVQKEILVRANNEGMVTDLFPIHGKRRDAVLVTLAKLLINRTGSTQIEALCRANEIKIGRRMENEEALKAIADEKAGDALFGFVTQIVSAMTLLYNWKTSKEAKALAAALGLDKKAIEAAVKERLKPKKG